MMIEAAFSEANMADPFESIRELFIGPENMRSQLLQSSCPFLVQSANKRAAEAECVHSLNCRVRDSLFSQQSSPYASFHKKKQCYPLFHVPLNSDTAISVHQVRYLKKQVPACLHIRNTLTKGPTSFPKSRSRFTFELTDCLSCDFARRPNILRVNAQNDEPRKGWLWRLLFTPLDPKDYPFLLDDPEDDSNDEEEEDGNKDTDDSPMENRKKGIDDDWCKDDVDKMLADDVKFAEWQQRAKARLELREFQEQGQDPENKNWEDWLDESWGDYSDYVGGKESGWYFNESDWEKGGVPRLPPKLPERGMNRNMKEMFFRIFEDEEEVKADLAFEDRIFRFTSQTTVKFVAVLIAVPWLVSYVAHDYVIVPFLTRWVDTAPLAAEMLDLRRSQKLNLVETLKTERQRVRFEAAIGKAPPLNDEELLEHIRDKAIELRDEIRLENRKAFGNIWADILSGLTIFLLLVFNPDKVAIMRLTGRRLFTNVSDTGKAFIIILLSDIFLGYHSESGWEALVEIILEHYGFEADKAYIYLFVAIVPVTIDACFKLWVFRFFTRLSPSATATFKEMKRH